MATLKAPSVVLTTTAEEADETSKLEQMKPHVPGIVTFADHNRLLPWSVTYHAVVMFADVSGFTSLCERYSTMGQSGVDQLTTTLNEYLSALVEGILGSDGDILKFAGDAILAIWRVGRTEELNQEIIKVVKCCLEIQDRCGEWDTDIGVKLTVKIGVSAGEMSVTFLGNHEYRHYVELGPAVTAVNTAESFSQSGMVVLSPDTLSHCDSSLFETEYLEDGKHVRVHSVIPRRQRSHSLPAQMITHQLLQKPHMTRLSVEPATHVSSLSHREPILERPPSADTSGIAGTKDSQQQSIDTLPTISSIVAPVRGLAKAKIGLGAKFGKLRKMVATVTEMKLDIALRLYILLPVLKKIDDGQPLAYLSEMRQVSIVFINLVLKENADSESLLQQVFEIVYAKSKAMHGSLNKVFLFDKGCTFLVIFGLPGFKHENDCMHALTCSGVMKNQLGRIDGVTCVSIGVTTGTTFCGVVGHPKRHEYSVIGRKVNMAARLMMHYPDKITCDTETFQTCRLSPSFFAVLITKRMKGLRNVGVIREFVGFSKDEKKTAKSIIRSDYPLLGRQLEEKIFRDKIEAMGEGGSRRHIIFNGPSGIGKTKLLDQLITIAQQKHFKVISCAVEPEDSSMPYFIANHILRTMLSNNGFSAEIDREPFILDAVGESDAMYFYLLNEVMELKIEKPISLIGASINEEQMRRHLLYKIAKACLVAVSETVIVIDDAHNMDSSSWEVINELRPIREALIVLGLRPSVIETPSCKDSQLFVDHDDVKLADLSGLDLNFTAPLACQMLDVVSIPKELDKLLRERSQGVPSWCLELLKDMIDQKQLIVTLDDGRPEFHQSVVAPSKSLIKPRSSVTIKGISSDTRIMHILNVPVTTCPRDVFAHTVQPKINIADLKYVYDSMGVPIRRNTLSLNKAPLGTQLLAAGGALSGALTTPDDESDRVSKPRPADSSASDRVRIAIFANGISAKDVPIPASMKELIIARLDSMRASDQLMVKCAAVLGKTVRRDILEMLLPKAHRPKLARTIRRLMESGLFQCSNPRASQLVKTNYGKDDPSQGKYRCFCNKGDVQTRYGEPETCFEPMFTNQLLQQTAYEVLMESQRLELHSKAATYFELSANELRSAIPYYCLYRSPGENLEEQLRQLEERDMFPRRRTGRRITRITDEAFANQAAEANARRGRRVAVSLTASEAFVLVNKVLIGARPLVSVERMITSLLPLYTSLCYHWSNANQPTHVLLTMVEGAAACIVVNNNMAANDYLEKIQKMIDEKTTGLDQDSAEYQVLLAKVERLNGKLKFLTGDLSAIASMNRSSKLLGLKQPMITPLTTGRLAIQCYLEWRAASKPKKQVCIIAMEEGYLLSDLFQISKQINAKNKKLHYALQLFRMVQHQNIHMHQVVLGFSALIECCRERRWVVTAERLEDDMLACCAARSDELSTDDRAELAKIYMVSCIHSFNNGRLEHANITGKTASEISLCIKDMDTIKDLAPYFVLICLFQNQNVKLVLHQLRKSSGSIPDACKTVLTILCLFRYNSCVELFEQLRYSGCMTQDPKARALYHVLCLEVAMAGECPPQSIPTCLCCTTRYLRACDASMGDVTSRYYVAMTMALWHAKRDKWKETQLWFDYWEVYETNKDDFFNLLGRANKLQCMLLSLCASTKIGNHKVAAALKQHIAQDVKAFRRMNKSFPVLDGRLLHLEAYFYAILGYMSHAERCAKKALLCTGNYGNKMETRWISQNRDVWRNKSQGNVVSNKEWNKCVTDHYLNWKISSSLKQEPTLFTLVLPMISKS